MLRGKASDTLVLFPWVERKIQIYYIVCFFFVSIIRPTIITFTSAASPLAINDMRTCARERRMLTSRILFTLICCSHPLAELKTNGGYFNIYEAHLPAHCPTSYIKPTDIAPDRMKNHVLMACLSLPLSPPSTLVITICLSILCDPPVSGPRGSPPDASSGLLLGVFVVCGLALLGLLTLASWKLCCEPWRAKAHFHSPSLGPACGPEHRLLQPPLPPPPPLLPPQLPSPQQPAVTMATEKVKDPVGSMGFLEAAVKISHTSPDIPTDVQLSMREHFLRRTQRMQRQTTEPTSSTRLVTYMCMCSRCRTRLCRVVIDAKTSSRAHTSMHVCTHKQSLRHRGSFNTRKKSEKSATHCVFSESRHLIALLYL